MSMEMHTDEEIEEVFIQFDVDESGKLETAELGHALNLLGIDLTPKELAEAYDIDDNPESMTLQEFKEFVRDRMEPMGINFQDRLVDAFREFDDTGEGKITRDVLMEILTLRGSQPLDQWEAEELLKECDEDGDGFYNAQEMAKVLCLAMSST